MMQTDSGLILSKTSSSALPSDGVEDAEFVEAVDTDGDDGIGAAEDVDEDDAVDNTDTPEAAQNRLEEPVSGEVVVPEPDSRAGASRPLSIPHWAGAGLSPGGPMNGFNRLVVTLLFVLLAAGGVYALVMMFEFAEPDPEFLGDSIAGVVGQLASLEGWYLTSAAVLSVSVVLLAVGVLRYELLPGRHRPVLVENSDLGRITIDSASICMLVERTVSALASVRSIHARMDLGDGGLVFDCDIIAEPHAVVTELGPQIQAVASERVRTQLGLEVQEVVTRIRFLSFKHDRRAL